MRDVTGRSWSRPTCPFDRAARGGAGSGQRLPRRSHRRAQAGVVDCNALDVGTVRGVGAVIGSAGAAFVDGGIIGGPPKPGAKVRPSTCPVMTRNGSGQRSAGWG